MARISTLKDASGNEISKGSKIQVMNATTHVYHAAARNQIGVVNYCSRLIIGEKVVDIISVKLCFPDPSDYDINSSNPPNPQYCNIYLDPKEVNIVDHSTLLNMDGIVLRKITTKTPTQFKNGFSYIKVTHKLVKWRYN